MAVSPIIIQPDADANWRGWKPRNCFRPPEDRAAGSGVNPTSTRKLHHAGGSRSLGRTASATQYVIDGNRPSAKEDQGKREGSRGEWEFISGMVWGTHESVVPMHFPDGDNEVDADRECGRASEQSHQDQQAAEKLGEGRYVAQPGGKAQTGDHLSMMVQSTKNLLRSVGDHDGAQGQAHDDQGNRLQAIKIAQDIPPNDGIDYPSTPR